MLMENFIWTKNVDGKFYRDQKVWFYFAGIKNKILNIYRDYLLN